MAKCLRRMICGWSVLVSLSAAPTPTLAQENPAEELCGVWEAQRRLGPDIHGNLSISQTGESWWANIAGFTGRAAFNNGQVRFEIPGNRGSFRGSLASDRKTITGFWTQPGIAFLGNRFDSPVTLKKGAGNQWRGPVVPLEDTIRFHLVVKKDKSDKVSAFIRNPEFNLGIFMSITCVEKDGDDVKLRGRYRFSDQQHILAEGKYTQENQLLSLFFPFPYPPGCYDLRRIQDDPLNPFYPRGATKTNYVYQPPQQADDGWSTATLDEVAISQKDMVAFIQMLIDMRAESVESSDIHGVLIARHGKLVLEEYFHGFHREKPHDTRSASKSLASILVGAAMEQGLPIKPTDSVWEILYGDDLPKSLDPRKKWITVAHLLTMSSGLACDDWNPDLPGEDAMQAEDDWRQYILNLPMAWEPGEKAAYCAGALNLVGKVLEVSSGKELPELIHSLVAVPLQIDRYYLNLTSNGKAYLGGGIHWLPRDFMKLGQVLLDQGQWNSKRVFSTDWAKKTIVSHFKLGTEADYGYTWWVRSYPYKGREVQAYFAGGNGGQIVMGFPELDLVLAFYGGNYNSPALFRAQREFVPEYILPAVTDRPADNSIKKRPSGTESGL